jgi:TolA-binding protein
MSFKKTFILIPFILFIFIASGFQNSSEHKVIFEKAKFTMETKGDLKGAIKLFEEIIKKYPDEREYAAKSQLYIGLCYEKLGMKQAKQAQKAFQKVIDNYPEQAEVVKVANENSFIKSRICH